MRISQKESEVISGLAARLRKARELLGITQGELGGMWGMTGNYIYMLEAGIKPLGKKLEHKVLELEGEVSKKLHSWNARSDGAVLAGKRAENEGTAPVVSWASAGGGGVFGDLEHQIEERLATDCRDPNKYVLIVEGDSMSPKFEAGDRIIVAPNTSAQNGDVVVARLSESGEVFLKLFHENHGQVRLTSFNAAYPPLEYKRSEFRFIQPVYALVRKLRGKKMG